MELDKIHNVYFIGIGGIGMSALARYFKYIGKNVAGYDRTPTQLTTALGGENIHVCFMDDVAFIPDQYQNKENTLVVITPAVNKNHPQWKYFTDNGYQIKKRAEVLGIITKDTFCFAVAGTHGKTTTSSILGHILHASRVDVTAFLGGVVEGYNSNLIGRGKSVTVVEADEFDRSFMHLHPNIACITSMDADHLDIYGDSRAIEDSFREFAAKVNDKNNLFVPNGVALDALTIGINDGSTYTATNITIQDGWYMFDIVTPTEKIRSVKFALPGRHNIANALLAFAMAATYGVNTMVIAGALSTFKGVKRRFSYQIKTDDLVYIDDYAHHPTEIDAVYNAVTELYPDKKIVALFQPHLYSRTRDFIDGFAKSLSAFDTVALLDIYPARELPIEGVTSQWLLDKITSKNKSLISKPEVLPMLQETDATVIVTIGAGDIGELVPKIKKVLHEKN